MANLFPLTENPEKLEKLAGVPPGTYALYKHLGLEDWDTDVDAAIGNLPSFEEFHNQRMNKIRRISEKPEQVRKLVQFIRYGWGVFEGVGDIAHLKDAYGSTKDQDEVDYLIHHQWMHQDEDVEIPMSEGTRFMDCEGLKWYDP